MSSSVKYEYPLSSTTLCPNTFQENVAFKAVNHVMQLPENNMLEHDFHAIMKLAPQTGISKWV